MNKFVSSIADVLEEPALELDTRFRETPAWCSLVAFGLLVTMENDWGAPLTIERLQTLSTVRDLYKEAFTAFAARLFGVDRAALEGASYGSIPQWDSVNHLRLVMEAEERFQVSFPLERIPSLRTIDDFIAV